MEGLERKNVSIEERVRILCFMSGPMLKNEAYEYIGNQTPRLPDAIKYIISLQTYTETWKD